MEWATSIRRSERKRGSMRTRRLTLRHEDALRPTTPFHFSGTVHKPSHFPASVDCFKNDTLSFSLRSAEKVYGIQLSPGPSEGEGVSLRIYAGSRLSPEETATITREVRYRFGLDLDLNGFRDVARKDPVLAPVEERWRGMRPSCAFSLYELLCITIVLQNAQVSRSVKMLEALLGRFGSTVRFGGESLSVFWIASELTAAQDEDLRELKVGYRSKSFSRVSRYFEHHPRIEEELRGLPREAAAKRLREIYGVGPATAWYLLFESLKHLDAFDHVSPWEQKILSRLLFRRELVPAERILEEARKRWGPWSMLAVHYLFEDLFWRRKNEPVEWLDELIRL